MSRKLNDPLTIGTYIDGIITRLDHHGMRSGITNLDSFKSLILTTMAKVFAQADSVEAKEYGGRLANAVWAEFGGRRYAFVFGHDGTIQIRPRTLRAATLHTLDETCSTSRVASVIAAL